MDRRLLVVGLLALLLAAGVCSWSCIGADASPPIPHTDGQPATAAAAATTDSGRTDRATADAARATAEPDRRPVDALHGSGRPLPRDPRWIEVRVIDRGTRAPVAGAEVGWVDESIHYCDLGSRFAAIASALWRWPEQLVRRGGWCTSSDANGIARITLREWTSALARHGDRYGELQLTDVELPPPGGHVIELDADRTLRVLVLDDRGEPAAGVPIAIGAYVDGRCERFLRGDLLATTRADGTATVPHVQCLFAEDGAERLLTHDPPPDLWRVRTYLAGHDDPGAPIPLADLPAEPIVLRLPPCGSFDVACEANGAPVPAFAGVRLEHVHPSTRDPSRMAVGYHPADATGRVRIPHVPLGARYRLEASSSGNLEVECDGPTRRGEVVAVRVAPAPDTLALAGRLVDEQRRPIRSARLHLRVDGRQMMLSRGFASDADGRFLVAIGPATEDNHVDLLRIESDWLPESNPRRLELGPRTLRPGVEQLGDLVLAPGVPIVAGTFVDGQGPCTSYVGYWLEYAAVAADGSVQWYSAPDAITLLDPSGRFEVLGEAPPGALRLAFDEDQLLSQSPVEVVRGSTDLVVRVDLGHRLGATVLVDTIDFDPFEAVLVPKEPPANAAERARLAVEPWTTDGQHHRLQWSALRAGTYTLELRLWSQPEPVLRLADVQVPGPDGGDPRLGAIDLRSLVRVVELHCTDLEGAPLGEDAVVFAPGQHPAATWAAKDLHQGSPGRLLLPVQGARELLVGAEGFRPRVVAVTGAHADVRLEPWPRLEVRIANLPARPPGVSVEVQLDPPAPGSEGDAMYHSQAYRRSRAEILQVGMQCRRFDGSRVDLTIGDGPHRLWLRLADDVRTVELIEPLVVLPTTGHVELTVPPAQWQAALAQFSAPR
ncbi:MAG: hypothetical protein JNL08_08100 [Planctomycetes bacterium]|nr:hypothetical protein [Planctomycetota bacterium]